MQSSVKRRIKVTVNGNPYLVEVDNLQTSPLQVTVNGQPYQVNIESNELEIIPANQPKTMPEAIAAPKSAPSKTPQPVQPIAAAVNGVNAPMPGNILNILVKAGDHVTFRQPLCSLEAMKMKNVIRSPRDGIIATVAITNGQSVAHNETLFTFE